jgi:hypothetical protein
LKDIVPIGESKDSEKRKETLESETREGMGE